LVGGDYLLEKTVVIVPQEGSADKKRGILQKKVGGEGKKKESVLDLCRKKIMGGGSYNSQAARNRKDSEEDRGGGTKSFQSAGNGGQKVRDAQEKGCQLGN